MILKNKKQKQNQTKKKPKTVSVAGMNTYGWKLSS